jgi:23S rRNA pseudouridine1911/1915/1917 synthase
VRDRAVRGWVQNVFFDESACFPGAFKVDSYRPSDSVSSSLRVLFEDNHVIAVFKPSGLLTQSDATGTLSLWDLTKLWLKEKYQKPGNVFLGLVHRIDKPVSGVVLFAKTSKAASRLSACFRQREISKEYVALVEGKPASMRETLVDFLVWEEGERRARLTSEEAGGKRASLEYRVLTQGPGRTLLAITLHTGRKHQIRAQLAQRGHPILGDLFYGAKPRWEGQGIALASKKIAFPHPISREILCIESPPGAIAWEGNLV